MDRDFALLGLHEDATQAQVRAAYERRLAKYKSADYADDPEYVRRKTAELKVAYEKAQAKASETTPEAVDGTEVKVCSGWPLYEDEPDTDAGETEKRQQIYRKQLKKMEEEERDGLLRSRKECENLEEKRFRKPDFSALKEKKEEMRKTAKRDEAQVGTAEPRLGNGVEGRQGDNSFVAGTAYSSSPDTGGFGKRLKGIVIALVVAFILTGITMCGEDVFTDTSQDVVSDYYTDDDWNTNELAVQVEIEIFNNLETAETTLTDTIESDPSKLKKLLDLFVRRYTVYDSAAQGCDDLFSRVDNFFCDSQSDPKEQARELLRYYGFPELETMQGYLSPYTGKQVVTMVDYLRFLNRYYREELA